MWRAGLAGRAFDRQRRLNRRQELCGVKLMPEPSSTTTPGAFYKSDRSQLFLDARLTQEGMTLSREAKPSAPRSTEPFMVENVGPV